MHGSFATVIETTQDVLAERRLQSVRALGQHLASVNDIDGLWSGMLHGLETNELDIPLALLYSVEERGDFSNVFADQTSTRTTCKLEGAIGVEANHAATPLRLDIGKGSEGFAKAFRNATMATNDEAGSTLLSTEDGTLPVHLLEGIKWRGYGAINKAVVCPISSTSSQVVLGYLLLGLNPRRPYDKDYQNFIQVLTKQVTTPHVSAVLLREELRRGQSVAAQAAIDKARLSQQLMQRTQDWEESKHKFSKFAERAGVGLTIVNAEGVCLFLSEPFEKLHP